MSLDSLCIWQVQVSVDCAWRYQRLPPARDGTAQRKIFHLANWSPFIHPGPTKSIKFFMESSQSYAATAPSASRTSLAKVPATCVQNARIGYIQDVLVFETLRIIVEPMAGFLTPVGRHHSHAHLVHRLVPPTHPPCQARRSAYFSGRPMASTTNRRN